MPKAINVIPTRQLTELLFSLSAPPPGGATVQLLPIRLVQGFDMVTFFGTSDAPFVLSVFEACSSDGPFVKTKDILSNTPPSSAPFFVCDLVIPCGTHMRVLYSSVFGVPTELSVCGQGVPVP